MLWELPVRGLVSQELQAEFRVYPDLWPWLPISLFFGAVLVIPLWVRRPRRRAHGSDEPPTALAGPDAGRSV